MAVTSKVTTISPPNVSPCAGTAIPNDDATDPDGIFSAANGLNVAGSAKDYAPKIPFKQVQIYGTANGQSNVTLSLLCANGSTLSFVITIPAYAYWTMPVPVSMVGIDHTATTATNVFPLF